MATGWDFDQIDRLTLPLYYELADFWTEWPPVNELLAMVHGYEKPLTMEEKIAAGAMGPLEFLEHAKRTGGKLPKN
jgi:hypothetical protein